MKLSEEEKARLKAIQKRIFEVELLGAMPQVVWQMIEELSDDRSSAATLEKIIESDVAMTSKVLSLANSAYYGMPQKITTIQRAVVIIGFQELEFLAMGAGLADVFDLKKTPPGFDGQELWFHCLAVSWLARELADASGYSNPGEVMIAGLLHDLGKLVLATHLTDELQNILHFVDQGLSWFEAEEKTGIHHTLIGYWLSKRWDLPSIHINAIRLHHDPEKDKENGLTTALVAVANYMAKKLEFGMIHESRPVDMDVLLKMANLEKGQIQSVAKKAKEKVPGIMESWAKLLNSGPI